MKWIKLYEGFNKNKEKIDAVHYSLYLWALTKFFHDSGYTTMLDQYDKDSVMIRSKNGLYLRVRQDTFHTGWDNIDKDYVSKLLCIPEKFGDARDNWEHFFAGGTDWNPKTRKYEHPYSRAKLKAAKLYIQKNKPIE